ncbi:MAG: hypothetical protein ACJAT2_001908 [Bacteriovoracaceae bacterium]|jgi:uncharacterized protein
MSIEIQAIAYVASELGINNTQVQKVLELIVEQDCTIPFISRYRKEAIGGLDEVQVGNINLTYEAYVEREKRRAYILETIKKQEMMTPELEKKILQAESLTKLEDLYAPYKSKRKSKGMIAREAGLEPLANLIRTTKKDIKSLLVEVGKDYINTDKKVESVQQALEGACHIIMEDVANDDEIKEVLRKDYWKGATLKSTVRKKAEEVKDYLKYKDYFEFEQKISELKSAKTGHRVLAMRRGFDQKILKLEVCYDKEAALGTIKRMTFDLDKLGCSDVILGCLNKAYESSIHSSLDLEMKSDLKKTAEEDSISVFGINLRNLLLQPYLGPKGVIGIDPGIRTGCKVAVIDDNGKFLVDTVVYPHEPKRDVAGTVRVIEAIIEKFKVEYIAIGNGTFGRETLQIIQKNVKAVKSGKAKAMLVNEDGASIYSASEIARKEFPDMDLTVRGAISIARRFQDPLAELVKIDPKSIGVGQYQHDVNQAKLKKSLTGVVESCVNFVGVDLNTASAPLLSYISGIGPSLAGNIVKEREKIGGFSNRGELLKVSRFSPKIFEQAAGFLRIYNSSNPLDGTFIHPERYEALEKWCHDNSIKMKDLIEDKEIVAKIDKDAALKETLGAFTHKDIVAALRSPSQDPRTEFVNFEFRDDINDIKDLKEGQWYPGKVTNITQFGAFVDIGIKENGLIHVSQMADKFVDNALEVLKVGQEVKARILEVDLDRKRIALSLKKEEKGEYIPSSSTGTSKPRSNNRDKKPEVQLKNNAFAGLANFKVK